MGLKISVITPSFRQGRFIERTIQSVLSQGLTADEYEYVVCDGGSDDETVEILKRYEDQLRWVSEPDKGQADAVNKGIAMTTGDIIAWINSDDVYYPEALKTVQSIFELNSEVQVIYGDAEHIDEFDQFIEPYPTESWDYKRLHKTCFLCQPAVFFRRNLIEQLGGLDVSLNYCMDYELWFRYGNVYPFHYIPHKLAGSRLYASNKTLGKRLEVYQEINNMLQNKFGASSSKWIFLYVHAKLSKELNKLESCADLAEYQRLFVKHSLTSFKLWDTHISFRAYLKLLLCWLRAILYDLGLCSNRFKSGK